MNNPKFSDDTAAFMVWSDEISLMLLTHAKWGQFTTRPIAPPDTSKVALSLTLQTRQAVDAMNEAASAHGGIADINPVQESGFMLKASRRGLQSPGFCRAPRIGTRPTTTVPCEDERTIPHRV